MKLCIVKISSHCGLNCIHCYLDSNKNEKELSTIEAERIFSNISELSIKTVALEGDHTDLISILEIANKFNLKITINTSAVGLNEKIIDKIAGHIKSIIFSIDGCDSNSHDRIRGETGVFDRTIDLIKYSKQKGIDITISSAISKANYTQIEGIISLAVEIGANRLTFLYTSPIGKASKLNLSLSLNEWRYTCNFIKSLQHKYPLKIYYEPVHCGEIENKQFCSAISHQYLAIDVDGYVYFCPLLIGHTDYSFGNIIDKDLSTICNSKNIEKIYNKKTNRGNCPSCNNYDSCAGICFIHSTNIIKPITNKSNDKKLCLSTTPLCYIYWEGLKYNYD